MSNERYYTDSEMNDKCALWALVCLGGMAEGFDYSEAKALMNYWGTKRRDFGYSGGVVEDLNAHQAAEYLKEQDRSHA